MPVTRVGGNVGLPYESELYSIDPVWRRIVALLAQLGWEVPGMIVRQDPLPHEPGGLWFVSNLSAEDGSWSITAGRFDIGQQTYDRPFVNQVGTIYRSDQILQLGRHGAMRYCLATSELPEANRGRTFWHNYEELVSAQPTQVLSYMTPRVSLDEGFRLRPTRLELPEGRRDMHALAYEHGQQATRNPAGLVNMTTRWLIRTVYLPLQAELTLREIGRLPDDEPDGDGPSAA